MKRLALLLATLAALAFAGQAAAGTTYVHGRFLWGDNSACAYCHVNIFDGQRSIGTGKAEKYYFRQAVYTTSGGYWTSSVPAPSAFEVYRDYAVEARQVDVCGGASYSPSYKWTTKYMDGGKDWNAGVRRLILGQSDLNTDFFNAAFGSAPNMPVC